MLLFQLLAATAAFLFIEAIRRVIAVRNKKSRSRYDQEAVPSPNTEKAQTFSSPNADHARIGSAPVVDTQLLEYKELYHKLHELERHPEILPRCEEILLSLLAETLSEALDKPADTILSLPSYSSATLSEFLMSAHNDTADAYEKYIARRRNGGSREMFADVEEAHWWLKQSSPVKYVDGAWLGHVNKISTPFSLRGITKNAWQVMSEELGDGDLEKNHIHVYRELMREIHPDLPEGYHKDFISEDHGLNETRDGRQLWRNFSFHYFQTSFCQKYLDLTWRTKACPYI